MNFTVGGIYNGEEALLTWTDGTVTGWPHDAVIDAELALRDAMHEGAVPGTPTGPFYEPGSEQAALLVLLSVISPPFELQDTPELPAQEDEIVGWDEDTT